MKFLIGNVIGSRRKFQISQEGAVAQNGKVKFQHRHPKEEEKKQPREEEKKNQPIEEEKENKALLEGKYKIKKKISQGGFGKVYLAINIQNKEEFIIKINAEIEMNDNEFKIMKHMSDSNFPGFPKVYSSGLVSDNQPYIIQERLGLSIKDILKRNKKHFSLKCVMTMGYQILQRLEKFHDEGFIHCDLKPDNILIGNYVKESSAMNMLFLIDFGISQSYLNEDGSHIDCRSSVPFKGNVIFSSKNAFAQLTLSRRDDIISLVYFLVFCINSKQSWINTSKPVNE